MSRFEKIKRNLLVYLYKKIYNIEVGGFNGSMLPSFGKGKFVSVYRKGDYIDIIDEKDGNMIRIIPFQPNHGVMVERYINGEKHGVNHLDLNMLMENIRYASNFDIFVDKIKYDRRIKLKQLKDKYE